MFLFFQYLPILIFIVSFFYDMPQLLRAPPKNKLTKMRSFLDLSITLALLSIILLTSVLFLLYLLGNLTPATALVFIATVVVLMITTALIGYQIRFQEKYDPM